MSIFNFLLHIGSQTADELIVVLLGTNMFIAGVVAFLLDNTITGMSEPVFISYNHVVRDDGKYAWSYVTRD